MKNLIAFILVIVAGCGISRAQELKPGFDADEYIDVLKRCAGQIGLPVADYLPKESKYERVYSSRETGMHNRWELWVNKDRSVMAVDLRGTTADIDSWLENFYSAMVPATGSLKLNNKNTIHYQFAADPKATVHVGWAIGICSMAPNIMEHISAWYAKGIKQIIVEGHSQGGALSFLLCSYLHYQVADGKLPKDLVIKTYCSAAPKPGNLYYAYDFDYINKGGWAFTIVNAADWVPETPFSIQTVKDINLNPYEYGKPGLKKQKLLARLYIKHVYNQLRLPARKTQRHFEKYLGRVMYKRVKKYMPELEQPAYAGNCNYMPAGTPVVLEPSADYFKNLKSK